MKFYCANCGWEFESTMRECPNCGEIYDVDSDEMEGKNMEFNTLRNRGNFLATMLAENLNDMSTDTCEILVQVRGKTFCCIIKVKQPDLVIVPDIGYTVAKIHFRSARAAQDYADAINRGKMLQTPIPFHIDDCPGCVAVYYSKAAEEVIICCNECGQRRALMLKSDDGCVYGPTILCSD